MDHLPSYEFQKCVERYRGDAHHRGFSCRDPYLAIAFAQLTYRESLRDIEACLGATKENVLLERRYSHPVDKSTGVHSDQTVVLATIGSASAYPDTLRRVSYFDAVTGKRLVFLTNNFTLPALIIAQIYKQRWQVELFFRWVKMHLRIKAFYGTSENTVKTQIWIAVSIYVLVAIVRKRLGIEASLYQILQIFSLTLFEKTPILQALQEMGCDNDLGDICNQLNLFDL